MRLALAGGSGFLGSALVPVLRADGHQVLRLVRRQPRGPGEVRWDPGSGELNLDALAGVDGAINLAGAPIGARRWTAGYKQLIRDSRVDTTATLAGALARLDPAPRVLLAASAAGYYGDTGTTAVEESAPGGHTFPPGVLREVEAAAKTAQDAGVRVALLRTGVILHPDGGSLARMFPLLRLGLGGPVGSGRQSGARSACSTSCARSASCSPPRIWPARSTSPPPTRCPTGRSSPRSAESCTAPPCCGCPPRRCAPRSVSCRRLPSRSSLQVTALQWLRASRGPCLPILPDVTPSVTPEGPDLEMAS